MTDETQDETQFDDVPREAFLATLAEGNEPNWKAEYADLYAKFRNRFHEQDLDKLNRQLMEVGLSARLTMTIERNEYENETTVGYMLTATESHSRWTFLHASFAEARAELLGILLAEHNREHDAESPAV